MSLVAELKRRKVLRVLAGYLVVGWLVIQVAATVLPQFDLPGWAPRLVTLLVALGLPIALVLAWALELTPEGLKVEPARFGSKRVYLAAAALAALPLGWFFLGGRFTSQETEDARSVAVLPFVNMSGSKDTEYFSDGISEEILNVLARMPELRVAARTSSFSFRDGKKEVPEIARALNVRMVLEGSVRRQADRVRITAQLIDARTGYHVWSQTYDRELADLFAIQDEIARAIASELKVKLGGPRGAPGPARKERSVEAHDLYLRGLALWQRRGEEDLLQALEHFRRAAAADPDFAEAHAGQALVHVILPDYSARVGYAESLSAARDAAERALGLDPALPEAYVVLGYLADGERRHLTAQGLYRRAIELSPSSATAHQWLGNSLWSGGQLEAGLAELERASILDPRSAVIANNRGMVLIALGRPLDARLPCEPILREDPEAFSCLESNGFAALQLGRLDEARDLFTRYAAQSNPGAEAGVREVFEALQGGWGGRAVAARLSKLAPQSAHVPGSGNAFQPYILTSLLVRLGEPGLALAFLRSFAETDMAGMSEWAVMQPDLGPLHCDPGFVELVRRIHTTDPHHARLCDGRP